jgi:hypothetical protein
VRSSAVNVLIAALLLAAVGSVIWAAQPAHWQPTSERPQVVRQEIEGILADRSYNHNYSDSTADNLSKRITRWIAEALSQLFDRVGGQVNTIGKTLSYALAGVVIVAFGVLAFFLVRRYIRRRNWLEQGLTSTGRSFDLPTSKPLIAESRNLAGAGNYREAFRLAYLASIAWLDEAKALRFDKSRTNWEYIRDLEEGGYDTAVGRLQPLTLRFDQVIYGHTDCRPADYEDMVDAFESLVAEAGSR